MRQWVHNWTHCLTTTTAASNVKHWLSRLGHVECWQFFNISLNIAAVVFRATVYWLWPTKSCSTCSKFRQTLQRPSSGWLCINFDLPSLVPLVQSFGKHCSGHLQDDCVLILTYQVLRDLFSFSENIIVALFRVLCWSWLRSNNN